MIKYIIITMASISDSRKESIKEILKQIPKYNRLYNQMISIVHDKNFSNNRLSDLEKLLNKTIPSTASEIALANYAIATANIDRGKFFTFAFRSRCACLLLLVDCPAIATALKLSDIYEIFVDNNERFHIMPLSNIIEKIHFKPDHDHRKNKYNKRNKQRYDDENDDGESSQIKALPSPNRKKIYTEILGKISDLSVNSEPQNNPPSWEDLTTCDENK